MGTLKRLRQFDRKVQNALISSVKKTFDFKSRAGRIEYFSFVLVFSGIIKFIEKLVDPHISFDSEFLSVSFLFSLVFIITQTSVSVRRLHDINLSGWWLLLIPTFILLFFVTLPYTKFAIIFLLLPFIFYFKKGNQESNRFGAPPIY